MSFCFTCCLFQDDDERRFPLEAVSKSAEAYALLLSLLSSQPVVAELAWRVLQLLPSNATLKSVLQRFVTDESRAAELAAAGAAAAIPAKPAVSGKMNYATAAVTKPTAKAAPAAPIAAIPGLTDATWQSLLSSAEPSRLLNALLV